MTGTIINTDMFLLHKARRMHMGLMLLLALLISIGLAMLYSAAGGDMDPWASRQAVRFIISAGVMLLVAIVDIRFWFRFAYVFYGLTILLLILVEAMGHIGMGAQRWISLGPINLQPSELAKVALVLALARHFTMLHLSSLDRLSALVLPTLLVVIPAALIIKQPDLGTAAMILMIGVAMFFVAGVDWKKFALAGVLGGAALPILWNMMHDYQKRRILTFLNPEEDPLGAGYNIMQSKIALGSGGLLGKGFGQGTQSQLNFLPEKQTDFIFTMLAEEFGFIGSILVLVLYALMIFTMMKVAFNCKSHFGKLMSMGVAIVLFLHVFINMAMVMGLVPVVGMPLPLLSYGGSNLLMILIGIGFVLNTHIHQSVRVKSGGLAL